MIEFAIGVILGIIVSCIFTTGKTYDLYNEIDKLNNIIEEKIKNDKN